MFFRNSFCSLLFCEIGNWQRANSDRDPCLRSGHQWHWWSCHHLLWWSWFQFCHIAATIAIQLRTHVSCGNLWQMIELQLPPLTQSNTRSTHRHTHRQKHRHWHTITLKSKTFGGGGKIPVGWRWKTLELRYYFHIGLWTMTVVVKTTQWPRVERSPSNPTNHLKRISHSLTEPLLSSPLSLYLLLQLGYSILFYEKQIT